MSETDRGREAALAAAIDGVLPALWSLSRRAREAEARATGADGRGYRALDDVERLVVRTLSEVLTPTLRSRAGTDPDFHAQLLEGFRSKLGGCDLSDEITDDDPRNRSALDQDADETTAKVLATLDEPRRAVAEALWRRGLQAESAAIELGRSLPYVRASERQIRFRLRHTLRLVHPEERYGDAALDGLVGQRHHELLPVTATRIRRDVLRRTCSFVPASFARRSGFALGTAAVAFGLWALMLVGVLPGPWSDAVADPAVRARCVGPCKPGQALQVAVLAPKGARFVAIGTMSRESLPITLVADHRGRSLSLPYGARQTLRPIAPLGEAPAWPEDGNASVTAVFSVKELSAREIEAAIARRGTPRGVWTISGLVETIAP